MLINFSFLSINAQVDTLYTNDNSLKNKASYFAKDSIYNDVINKKIYLYGDAKLDYDGMKLTADFIIFDLKNEEVFATYSFTKDSIKKGIPILMKDGEETKAGSIRFNLKTKKGYIQEVQVKQEENYLQMSVAKRQANEQIHFKDGKFTTCELEHPHFHFHLYNAILIPNEKIISKRMKVHFREIPTFVGLPFIVIPQQKKKINNSKHGLLFPKIAPTSTFGFGVSDLGYYIPINDSIHTTFLSNFFSSGSYSLSNLTEYKIKYKFNGRFNLMFQQNNSGFPENNTTDKYSLSWSHQKDGKANPYWNFNSNVNFISDNNSKNTLDPLNNNFFTNTFKSDINLQRSFPNKPIVMGLKISTNQNTSTKMMDLTSPIFTTNITRFYPLKIFRQKKIGEERWYEKISMNYNLEAKNQVTFEDSLLKNKQLNEIKNKFLNGVSQNTTVTTTVKLFKNTVSFTPSMNYSHSINFQKTNKEFRTVSDFDPSQNKITSIKKLITSTDQSYGSFQRVSASAQLTTQIYSYYKFIGKKSSLIRHIITPSVSYNFSPKTTKLSYSYQDTLNKTINYSPYERSLYQDGSSQGNSMIQFNITNTFELKRKSLKDTLTGFKKTRLIDGLSFNGSYDIKKDSMKLSDIGIALRINPIEYINIVASSNFSPYAWDPITKKTLKKYAFQNQQQLGRITNANINTTLTITSEKFRRKIEENKKIFDGTWNSELRYYALHPEQFIDFDIPWKINLSHVLTFSKNLNKTYNHEKDHEIIQTIYVDGDVNLTKKWKLASSLNFDFNTKSITNTRITITRNLHCWNLSFFTTPIGTNKSFLLQLVANGKLLQDAKLEFRKPPSVF